MGDFYIAASRWCMVCVCTCRSSLVTFVTEQNFDLESTGVLCQQVVLAWKLLASFPLFSKVFFIASGVPCLCRYP